VSLGLRSRKGRQEPSSSAAFGNGGGGNRTRVPWHFSARFYVCSSSRLGVLLPAFARADPDEQSFGTGYRSEGLAVAATEPARLATNLKRPRS
jgi:hypothetical protein